MKHKIYKGGVDNYPLWWYGQSNRLQNFGDRPNYLVPNGPVFKGNGYYLNGTSDYLEDAYGRKLLGVGTKGTWSFLYLTNGDVPPCGSIIATSNKAVFCGNTEPKITGKVIINPEYYPGVKNFNLSNNELSVLDVSRSVNLVYLYCFNNQLLALDVSRLVLLSTLFCYSNNLFVLDVSNLALLGVLKCGNNNLTTLDVSKNNKIVTLDCSNCLFDSAMVDKVLCDANNWGTSDGTLDISGNTAPSQTGIDAKNDMVNNRGWTVTTD